jgi:hypothetical protein
MFPTLLLVIVRFERLAGAVNAEPPPVDRILLETANTRLSQKVGETSVGKALGPAIFVSVTAAHAQR